MGSMMGLRSERHSCFPCPLAGRTNGLQEKRIVPRHEWRQCESSLDPKSCFLVEKRQGDLLHWAPGCGRGGGLLSRIRKSSPIDEIEGEPFHADGSVSRWTPRRSPSRTVTASPALPPRSPPTKHPLEKAGKARWR